MISRKTSGEKDRDSNLELYRCIVMLMIVAHHFVFHSGLMDVMSEEPTSWRSVYLYLFGAWGKVGIDCFVLITGFFMCKSSISSRKFVKLLFQIEFYKIVIYILFLLFGYDDFSFESCAKTIMPIVYVSDDFVGCFILFYLFIPYLNILINNMHKKQHGFLILLCLFVYSLLPLFPYVEVFQNYVIWFAVLYIISSYLRLYGLSVLFKYATEWTVLSILITSASICFFLFYGMKWPYYLVFDANKVLALAVSVCSFTFFRKLKVQHSKIINIIGSSTFGVLLIHDSSWAMRTWLWQDVINAQHWYYSNIYFYSIAYVLFVFVICSLIDMVRYNTIEKPLFRLIDSIRERY